jgi:hypothetical protein
MDTIAEAAPGAVPQAAVLPDKPPKRTEANPTIVLNPIVTTVAASMIGHDCASVPNIDQVTECATSNPMQPWPNRNT